MPSIPLTPSEEKEILKTLGVQSVDDLFSTIPPKIRQNADFKIPLGQGDILQRGLTEHELRLFFSKRADRNAQGATHFLGGGVYDNVIPALVNQLTGRGEFLTCYTPYQPEISQGTLQAIFEFQTLISRLMAMEVANASMYDGPTATSEAVLMARRFSRSSKPAALMASSLTPDTKSVITTFMRHQPGLIQELPWNRSGTVDLGALETHVKSLEPFAVVVGYPNYFGIVEPLDEIRKRVPESCLLIVAVADPSAVSLFEAPGILGADIVAGEAHQLGTPMMFGGPHVGFLACRKKLVRQMPGRLVGETRDSHGNRCYTLTLATREQHIRREQATSNICSNEGLIALRTTIYLSFLGKTGFQMLGKSNYSRFEYLRESFAQVGIPLKFPGTLHYREGVFEIPNLSRRFEKALQERLVPGIRLKGKFPLSRDEFDCSLLVTVNPKHDKSQIDRLVEVMSHD